MINEVDDALVRIQRKGWVRSPPVSHGLVNLCDKRLETVSSLEVECNDPVRSKWSVRLEGPKEGDDKLGDVSSILSGSVSKHSNIVQGQLTNPSSFRILSYALTISEASSSASGFERYLSSTIVVN